MRAARRHYTWSGLDAGGRRCAGRIDAIDPAQAWTRLRGGGLLPLRVRRSWRAAPALTRADRTPLYRELALLLGAGLPLLQALSVLPHRAAPELAARLAGGSTLAQAMGDSSCAFPRWDCALVAAAEQAGQLDAALQRLAIQGEAALELRAKVRTALLYPLVVLATAGAVSAFIVLVIVPSVPALVPAAVPLPTRILLRWAAAARDPWAWLLASPTLALTSVTAARLLRRVPPWSTLLAQRALAEWCALLAMFERAGLPLLDALAELGAAAALGPLAATSARLGRRVAAGSTLTQAMRAEPALPPQLVQLVDIGERAGRLETLLEQAAALYREQLQRRLDRLSAMVEPALLLGLGLYSAALLLAVYAPLLQLGQTLG